jgi:preprotein translocase subunit SecE
MKQNIVGFVQDVGNEMKRVSWPSREQLQESTLITIVFVLFVSVLVFAVDWIFTQIFSFMSTIF